MKKIVSFSLGDEIPNDATFIHFDKSDRIYYELPIKEVNTIVKNPHIDTIKLVIDYLNKKIGSKYTYRSKETVKHIRARLNEGRTYHDFVTVINKKSDEWLDDPRFSQYLRPQTLFSPKFDGYLSQKSGKEMENVAFSELDKIMEGK